MSPLVVPTACVYIWDAVQRKLIQYLSWCDSFGCLRIKLNAHQRQCHTMVWWMNTEQESCPVGCVPPACQPYRVVSQIHISWGVLSTHLGVGEYPPERPFICITLLDQILLGLLPISSVSNGMHNTILEAPIRVSGMDPKLYGHDV